LKQPSYGLLDAQIAYTKEGLTIRFWGSNLTGKHYYENVTELAYYAGDAGFPGAPRMVGVGFEYKFKGNARPF
jgi:outer membrane receptor protein involved in Fe transport